MRYPSLKTIEKLKLDRIPSQELAYYAYALTCCRYPASVVSGEWYQKVDDLCSRNIAGLRKEIMRRGDSHALAVLDGDVELVKDEEEWPDSINLAELSSSRLVELHSMSKYQYDMRRRNRMEVFTRSFQWRIVNELTNRKDGRSIGNILMLAESLEADNYAHIVNLPYTMGDRPKIFSPSEYADDDDIIKRIHALTQKADYISREELIQIADYIQTEIVTKEDTVNHIDLVDAIIGNNTPDFDYPEIVSAFERATKSLARSKDKKEIDMAPYYYNLWGLTQKPSYLSRFETTLRRCYLTLAKNRHYPNLGINMDDSVSLSSALRFLEDYRLNVWVLNENYDVDKVIAKYKSAWLPSSNRL